MTKFHYMSDLHIEFAMPKTTMFEGENLILAGDITVLRCLNPTKTDAANRKLRDRTLTFFEHMVENFDRVFYLTGNHESYGFNIDQEAEYIAEYLPNVEHLNNTTVFIDDDTLLFGGTLWTNMNNGNPVTMETVRNGMNDFRLIYKDFEDSRFEHPVFTPKDALDKHKDTMYHLENLVKTYPEKKIVVATHHVPTIKGVNPVHHGSGDMNFGYYTDLEQFILDHPNITHWVFGHTHIQDEFEIGSTKMLSNARGYEGHEMSAKTFNPDKWFEV